MLRHPAAAAERWFTRWRPVLPLMSAELILWLGFGAFLPVLPLYVTERGVDVPTLGVVIAAWPAARLLGEPIFGWLADHTRRVPLMVIGLLASAVFAAAPLALTGFVPFLVVRGLAGLAAALYDPSARGYLMDATPADRRGEAFGLYTAAQMAGFLLGPALGAVVAAVTGSPASVFVVGGVSVGLAGLVVAFGVHEQPRSSRRGSIPAEGLTELQRESPVAVQRAAASALRDQATSSLQRQAASAAVVLAHGDDAADPAASRGRAEAAGAGADAAGGSDEAARAGAEAAGAGSAVPVLSLLNRCLIAAIVLNFGGFFAGGTWEVIWSLFMQAKGASLEAIAFTFVLFSLPVLVVSPFIGRLVDRRGPIPFIVAGSVCAVVTGLAYTLADDLVVISGIVVVEALGWALVNPALYAVVAMGSPPGRSSTAQGVFGSAGTVAYIVSSVVAGRLLATDLRYPFYLLVAVILATLVIALAILGRGRLTGPAWVTVPARPDPVRSSTGSS